MTQMRPLPGPGEGRADGPGGSVPGPLPVLDPQRLAMIRALDVAEEGGATGELLATFAQEAAEGVQRLTAAVHARDAEGVAHEAHALMGTAAMFGLPQLAATAGELEQAGVEGDLQAAAGLLDALNRDLTRGLEALASATGEASPEPGH